MKNTFKLEIASPCSENFDKMTPNNFGSFCDSCAKTVIDFSQKSNFEIGKTIFETKDKSNICARMKVSQLSHDYTLFSPESKSNFKQVAAIAASILLTSGVLAQEKDVTIKDKPEQHSTRFVTGKIAPRQVIKPVEWTSYTLKGKILNAETKKPFSKNIFKNLMVSVSGIDKKIKVDSKTGTFEMILSLDKNQKSFEINFSSNEKYFFQTILIDAKSNKSNIIIKKFIIKPEDFNRNLQVLGGLGINSFDKQDLMNIPRLV